MLDIELSEPYSPHPQQTKKKKMPGEENTVAAPWWGRHNDGLPFISWKGKRFMQ